MTNRPLAYIVRNKAPLVLAATATVRIACRLMWERRAGSVLVVDGERRLTGIFTGRDAVRLLARPDASPSLPLAEAMTANPVTVRPQSSAMDALRAMSEGGFRHMPVVADGQIQGIVSRGDFKGMEFEEFRWRTEGPDRSGGMERTIGEIIANRQPLVCGTDDTVAAACAVMCRHRAGAVLVADRRQHLAGIFTGRDAVRSIAKLRAPAAARLAKAMTADPLALPPETTAIEALRAMNDGGFRHIPVVAGTRILGVVSRNDFTGREIDRLDEEEHLKECIW